MNTRYLILALAIVALLLGVVLIIDYIIHFFRQHGKQCKRADGIRSCEDVSGAAVGRNLKSAGKRADDSLPICGSKEERPAVFDLMGQERPTLAVALPPDRMVIHLLTPTKAMSDRFQAIGRLLERLEVGTLAFEGIEQLFKFAAMLLSENQEGRMFTVSELKSRCSAGDIGALLEMYLGWLTEVVKSKN